MKVEIKLLDYVDYCKLDIVHSTALTGHTHYKSPYECYDDCGTCDGAWCDYCKKVDEFNLYGIEMDKPYFMEMIRNEVYKQNGYLPDYTTLEKWYVVFKKWIQSINTEANESIKFNFLKLKVEITSFTIYDIGCYKSYLLDPVYCILLSEKRTLYTLNLYTLSKDFAEKLETLGRFYIKTMYRYGLKGDEIFIKEDK